MTPDEFTRLVRSLLALGRETEWLEFKHNNTDPQETGACLMYVSGKRMTNATLRKRLGIDKQNYPQASRIIREATDSRLID